MYTLFGIMYKLYEGHPAKFVRRGTMPTRSEILDTLAASQEQVTAYFGGLSLEELERPCTASAVPGEAAWRAKDHFAHLVANERNIQILLRLTLLPGLSVGCTAISAGGSLKISQPPPAST